MINCPKILHIVIVSSHFLIAPDGHRLLGLEQADCGSQDVSLVRGQRAGKILQKSRAMFLPIFMSYFV